MKTILIVLALSSVPCIAQTQNPQVIFDSCAQAMGGRQRQDLQVIAEGVESMNEAAPITIRLKTRGLADFRIERNGTDQTELTIISKGKGLHREQGETKAISPHTVKYFKPDHLPALLCGIDLSQGGMRVIFVGDEMVGARSTFHLKVDALPRGESAHNAIETVISEYHLFIDQQTFTLLKTAKFVFSPNSIENRSTWETHYSDYRTIDGILMPFRIENSVNGRKISTTILTSVTINATLSNQEFDEVK